MLKNLSIAFLLAVGLFGWSTSQANAATPQTCAKKAEGYYLQALTATEDATSHLTYGSDNYNHAHTASGYFDSAANYASEASAHYKNGDTAMGDKLIGMAITMSQMGQKQLNKINTKSNTVSNDITAAFTALSYADSWAGAA